MMEFLVSESNDPCFNLSLEEILLKTYSEEFLILSVNSPSVIIGKHQVPYREINPAFVVLNGIPVLRRISGGGTVFHDYGNLNFSFILNSEQGKQVDFRRYTAPVIDFLHQAGINAVLEGRNDLKVNGLKISGNAEHVHKNRVLHHGTLLFNSSLDSLGEALKSNPGRYNTIGVKSNPSPVININQITDNFDSIDDFRDELLLFMMKKYSGTSLFLLPEDTRDSITASMQSKYSSWEWNYGYGPAYEFSNNLTIREREFNCEFSVSGGIIKRAFIGGDSGLKILFTRLEGCRHSFIEMKNVLNEENELFSDNDIFNLL